MTSHRSIAATVAALLMGCTGDELLLPLAPPTLATLGTSQGIQGTAVPVTIVGTNFVPGATTVAVSGAGVTVSDVSVGSETSLTATFTLDAAAAAGTRDVTVTTGGGTSGARTFTIGHAAPTLTSITPAGGVQGETVAVLLTGTSFVTGATTVGVSGTGVTVADVSVTSATSLTANLSISAIAAMGARDVTVTTAGGTTAAQTFTVDLAAPTLASVTPNDGAQTGTRTVTLAGTNFVTGATTVSVAGAGVTVGDVSVTSSTTLTATFTTDGSAALGARDVTVTTGGGTSSAQAFTVVAAPAIALFAARATHLVTAQPTFLDFATADATSCEIVGVGTMPCNSTSNVMVTPGVTRTYTMTATRAGATVQATADVFVDEPGRWAYASAAANDQLRMYSRDATTGALTPIGGGTIAAGDLPFGVAVDPAGRYAYAVNVATDNVSMYRIDVTTGTLTANGTIGVGDDPVTITVDPTGRYAYVIRRAQTATGSISSFTIGEGGALAANGPAIPIGGVNGRPQEATVDPTGRYLYATMRGGGIAMFSIDADGTLTSLGTVSTSQLYGVVVDPSGRFAYASKNTDGGVKQYAIAPDGTLTSIGADVALTGTIRGVAVHPSGRFFYATDFNNNIVHALAIDPVTGALTGVNSQSSGGGVFVGPELIALDPQGRFLYAANSLNTTISTYSIDPTTGALTFVNNTPGGGSMLGIAVSR